jgi:ElaB/YqjD/DUF883 family membrane-anchored ribosome-binding protein
MQTTPDSLKNKTDQAAQGLNHLINNASDALHPAIDGLTAKAHSTVDSLASAANHGIDNFDARSEQLSKARQRAGVALRGQFEQRPVMMLGIAVASGVLLSWLFKSRHQPKSHD